MGGGRMKKYEVQYTESYDNEWGVIDCYNSLEEAKERVIEEKRNDEKNWAKGIYKYRILIYEVIEL